MFFTTKDMKEKIASNLDQFNDSYARNTTVEELRDVSAPHSRRHHRLLTPPSSLNKWA
jgi:DNA ligase-4